MKPAEHRILQAIALLESQRGQLGDDVVSLALAPLRDSLVRTHAGGAQQLRQVSVLVCDMVGSTPLGQRLSPEQMHEVIDGLLVSLTRVVHARGGTVLQYAGDSLLAVWGAPRAQEGDAAAAVGAALAALDEAREHAALVLQRHGHEGFNVRAGIATGPVLLGGGVEGDQTIRGITVHIAARMEQTAPPGQLRVCTDTWRLARGQFEGEEQPPLAIKGLDEPMVTWMVRRARADAPVHALRGVDGVATPCVGRAAEMQVLQQALLASRAPQQGPQAVVVVAEPGLGKSRLAAEFQRWAQAGPGGARVLAVSTGERDAGRPYGLMRRLFTLQARVRDSDSPELARERWLQALTPLLRSQADAAVLGQLLGLDFAEHPEVQPLLAEAQQLRDRAFFHATQALRALASGGPPLALVLDDLHWADPGSLDFLDRLQQQATGLPLLLLMLTRPELDTLRPGWRALPGRTVVTLQALGPADADALAGALLARLPLDAATRHFQQRLTATAAGNPFFMEELVNMMIDRGRIAVASASWRLSGPDLQALPLPRTLAGVLQARLDQLGPGETRVLQGAAVVGAVFWDDALAALGLDDAPAALAQLEAHQFIVQQAGSRVDGAREYAFRHQLLHQACYERVLQRDRVPAHARVARWLESLPGERPLDQIAEHHERGEEPARALPAWHRAAQQAQSRYANEQALAHAARALALVAPDEHALRFELTLLRVRMHARSGQAEARLAELAVLDELAELQGDDLRRCQALEARASWHLDAGQAEPALQLARRVQALAPAHTPQVAAYAGRLAVYALRMLGRADESQQEAEALLALARRTQDRATEGAMLNSLGLQADDRGDPAAAIGYYEQALQCHRATGNAGNEGDVLSNLGYVELGLGAYEDAAARFEAVLVQFRRTGQPEREASALLNLALAALHSGAPARAADLAGQALPMLQAAGSRWLAAAAQRIAGQAALAQGLAAEAVARLRTAQAEFEALKLRAMATEATASLALALQQAGQTAEALQSASAVLAQLAGGLSLQGCEEPLRVHADCWQVLQAQGDPRAADCLAQARRLLAERADRVHDAARRHSFLHRVPHHRLLHAGGGADGTDHMFSSLGSSRP